MPYFKSASLIISFILAIWFLASGMTWSYGAALIIAYPAGLLSLLFWLINRREKHVLNRIIPIILSVGLALSISVLCYMLIFG